MMIGEKQGKSLIGYNLSHKLERTAHTDDVLYVPVDKLSDVLEYQKKFTDRLARGVFHPKEGFDNQDGKIAFDRKIDAIKAHFVTIIQELQTQEKLAKQKKIIEERQNLPPYGSEGTNPGVGNYMGPGHTLKQGDYVNKSRYKVLE